MTDEEELWEKVKHRLSEKYGDKVFKDTFLPITQIHKVYNNYIYLVVATALIKFRIEKFYLKQMNEILSELNKDELLQFKIITQEDAIKETKLQEIQPLTTPDVKQLGITTRNLRPEYTFANFVTGEANRQAFTFAVNVAESPNVTINPLYIFGDVGLGKTHLMMAIGHYILDNNIHANVVYTTAQQFIEDYFKSKNKNQKNTAFAEAFDTYYRSADVFLVDDIQYLADKQGSQDEFFKLFEFLFENNKQIIVTSDRPASELNIMARLKSRFSWGIQADVKKPNQQLRLAILQHKLPTLINNPEEVSKEALEYIATNFDENVRELEGALRRFISYCVSFNIEYTLSNAQVALQEILPKDKNKEIPKTSFLVEKVKEVISSYYNIQVKDLSSQSRKQEFVYARNVAIYIFKTKYDLSLKKIGEVLGGRDHSTIAHSFDKIQELLQNDDSVKQDIDNLIQKI